MVSLLDVNLLIALSDASHVHHAKTRSWFKQEASKGWATCPLTENGLIRIVGNPKYPGSPGEPETILPLLSCLKRFPGHQFWQDSISLTDTKHANLLKGASSKSVTDLYLLALAMSHGGRLATLDSRIDPTAITGGAQALIVLS